MFIHVKNAILTCVLVVRTILSLLRIDASMPLRLSAVIQSRMIFFFLSENMFMHVKNAILTRALVVHRVMSPLSISANEKIAFFLIFTTFLFVIGNAFCMSNKGSQSTILFIYTLVTIHLLVICVICGVNVLGCEVTVSHFYVGCDMAAAVGEPALAVPSCRPLSRSIMKPRNKKEIKKGTYFKSTTTLSMIPIIPFILKCSSTLRRTNVCRNAQEL